jgi:FtsP/CotA-like multicopper oxidase with cupredoxin domain
MSRVVPMGDGYPGKYVFHCHNLEHEDMMMANSERADGGMTQRHPRA